MKFSLKLPDNQDHQTPVVKGKLPITMFNQPFTSSFTSAVNSSSDLSFSLSTNFPSGPCLKLTYSPMAASPSAVSTTSPFTLSLKSGLGLFGSPEDSPLVFSSQFSLSLSKPFVPTFSLLFKPQFGHFCLKKSTVSGVHDQFSVIQPNDGVRLDSGSGLNSKFGSGFAVDESMGWQELKLESSGGGHGSQEEFGVHSDGGIRRHLAETKSIRDSVFSGVAVMARTAIPVTKRVAVNFRWGMNFPTNPVTKMPFLTVNKISVERVEEEKEEKKKTGENQGGDVELLKGMLFWMKKDVESLEKENREMKQLLEEMKLGNVTNRAAPSSSLSYGEMEPWRNNRSGWEESKSKNSRNGGQENDWRKKKSSEEENDGKNRRRGGEKNGGKGLSSTNRANEVESELERAIKAASQVKA
ncbi:uncharacterized protein LOC120090129 [Benincasa hispida]|uniref:uncharacterized protein LOC120090129 n=1 Tax=Benincasa hispida TaxID=102211 RepID=UPI0019012CBB|nr:uncharacterized protein LOC120090129 [Benincasa hispida]